MAKFHMSIIPASITNRAHRGAFARGWNAQQLGAHVRDNPYHVHPEDRFGNSYRRVFARMWAQGWSAAARYEHLHQVRGVPARDPA